MPYFDYAASTPVDPEVLKIYADVSAKYYANPSSIHGLGQEAASLLEKARQQILASLDCQGMTLVFTSGATEANNLAILGYSLSRKPAHLITAKNEHASVLECFRHLERLGYSVTYLDSNADGFIDARELEKAMRKDTILVSLMGVNNETGSINPMQKILKVIEKYPRCVLHSDMAQAIGKVEEPLAKLDMFTVSGHKIHGLKGSGALVMKKGLKLEPILYGGGQESGLVSGTNDLASSIALARSIRLILEGSDKSRENASALNLVVRDYLLGHPEQYEINSTSLNNPFILNFSTLRKKASVVVEALSKKGYMVSSVSACSSKSEPISHVLLAMGKGEQLARNTIRLSFDGLSTIEETKGLITALEQVVGGIRE